MSETYRRPVGWEELVPRKPYPYPLDMTTPPSPVYVTGVLSNKLRKAGLGLLRYKLTIVCSEDFT